MVLINLPVAAVLWVPLAFVGAIPKVNLISLALVILLMTGFADQRERAFGLDSLVYDVVPKPFTLADIRQAVGRALASRGGGEARASA